MKRKKLEQKEVAQSEREKRREKKKKKDEEAIFPPSSNYADKNASSSSPKDRTSPYGSLLSLSLSLLIFLLARLLSLCYFSKRRSSFSFRISDATLELSNCF